MPITAAGKRVYHHSDDENIAYKLQIMGAREGAIKGTLVGGTLVALANYRYPWMRKQTLAGKTFLAMWGTIFGMVVYADTYLLQWEHEHRATAERWRVQAKRELAASGTVPNETTLRAWKQQKDLEATKEQANMSSSPSPLVKGELRSGPSSVIEELSATQAAKNAQNTEVAAGLEQEKELI